MRAAYRWLLILALLAPSSAFAGASGLLDPFFGVGGVDTGTAQRSDLVLALDGSPVALDGKNLLLPDGKVATVFSQVADEHALCRRYLDRTVDLTFGGNGTGCATQAPLSGGAYAIARQSDGKLLVAGWVFSLFVPFVARYDASGIVDPSFGINGVRWLDFGPGVQGQATAMVVQPDDRIVVGAGGGQSLASFFGLARLDAGGTPDPTFGSGGTVVTSFTGLLVDLQGLALQSDGRVVAVGDERTFDPYCDNGVPTRLVRYTTSGSLDPTFGTGGVVSDVFGPVGGGCTNTVLVQSDGKILVGGSARVGTPIPARQPALARYLADGSRDTAFGRGGISWTAVPTGLEPTDFGFSLGGISAFARQADSGIVATGSGNSTIVRWFGGTCGNSVVEAGEDCDDGNLVSGDGCDANCCTSDTDSDGLCDAVDACTGGEPVSGMQLSLTGFGTGGDEFKPVGSSRVDLQACKLEYSIVSPK